MTNCNFSLMFLHLQNYGQSRRKTFNNQVVLEIYNDELVQLCTKTQTRSSYSPNINDLQANDWELIFMKGDESLHKNHLLNALISQGMKFSSDFGKKKSVEVSVSHPVKSERRNDKLIWFILGVLAGVVLMFLSLNGSHL